MTLEEKIALAVRLDHANRPMNSVGAIIVERYAHRADAEGGWAEGDICYEVGTRYSQVRGVGRTLVAALNDLIEAFRGSVATEVERLRSEAAHRVEQAEYKAGVLEEIDSARVSP